MNLNDSQKAAVARWIADGLKLAEIQSRLAKELGAHLTYMEVRFLVDDLKLVPKDPPAPVEPKSPLDPAAAPKAASAPAPAASQETPHESEAVPAPATGQAPAGNVTLTVDAVTRPGTLVSGTVTFSDGMKAVWYLDQFGRLGVVADKKGYKPSQADVQKFQIQLEAEMAKLGY